MEYLNESDYLNNDGVRNENNTSFDNFNCAGYALKTYSWYHPYKFFAWEYIEDKLEEGFTRDEIVEDLLEVSKAQMLEDFKNLRYIEAADYNRGAAVESKLLSQLADDEELIAFRIGLEIDDTFDYEDKPIVEDYDFHYRVFRNGHWCEKLGDGDLESCKFTEGIWDGFCVYDSPIYYFAMKAA